jgi:hypothetical protein
MQSKPAPVPAALYQQTAREIDELSAMLRAGGYGGRTKTVAARILCPSERARPLQSRYTEAVRDGASERERHALECLLSLLGRISAPADSVRRASRPPADEAAARIEALSREFRAIAGPDAETTKVETPRSPDAASQTDPASEAASETAQLSAEAKAIAMLIDPKHRGKTDTEIARAVGVNRKTLYRWNFFKTAKAALRGQTPPRGSKSKDGNVEAHSDE